MNELQVGYEIEMLTPYSKIITKNKINSYLKEHLGCSPLYINWVHATDDVSVSPGNNKSLQTCEIISHPFEHKLSMQMLKLIFQWMQEHGCKTNTSTGLHVNVSFKTQRLNKKVNPVMLIATLDDYKLAKYFNRERNYYCVPWITRLTKLWERTKKWTSKNQSWSSRSLMDIFKAEVDMLFGLIYMSTRAVTPDSPAEKMYYTLPVKFNAINFGKLTKNYIEFRMVGGKNYHINPHIYDAVDHIVYAMEQSITPDPQVIDAWYEQSFT